MSGADCFRHAATAVIAIIAVASGVISNACACGLEPTVKGGFTVSHPGALDVAVAVSKARRAGLFPQADATPASNAVQLKDMLADLRQLESRLNAGLARNEENSTTAFSLVLVGPGLWSHYHPAPDGIRAEYHTDGPLTGRAVVLTHHAVLRALLKGDLSTEQAVELGLIAYSGSDTAPIQSAFDTGFQSSS